MRYAIVLVLVAGSLEAAPRPNVLFIAVDDLNDWIGCMEGHPQALTPNMDRLAAQGILFTNAHCASPACNPSRAAVFSGRMPPTTGVWSNQSGSLDRLYPGGRYLTTAFSENGYQVLGTGKLLHSGGKKLFHDYFSVGQRWSPLSKKAVTYTRKELPTKGTSNPRHVVRHKNGKGVVLPLNRMPSDRKPDRADGESFDWGPFAVADSEMGDAQITDWAMAKLKKGFKKPFFLGVGYYRPHIPLWAPKKYFERFVKSPGKLPTAKENDLEDLSAVARKWALEPVTAGSHLTVVKYKQWQAAVEGYLACTTFVDHQLGRLLSALERSGAAKTTWIVLWSDHGWHLGEKQHWGKWTGWERSTRVPLILVPPKTEASLFAKAGSQCDQPVSLIDLYPTLVELCGLKPPKKLDGWSLVPLLKDPKRATERVVVSHFDRGNTSLRSKRWRYIRYKNGSEELYDHSLDRHEHNNLADNPKYAKVKAQMAQSLP